MEVANLATRPAPGEPLRCGGVDAYSSDPIVADGGSVLAISRTTTAQAIDTTDQILAIEREMETVFHSGLACVDKVNHYR